MITQSMLKKKKGRYKLCHSSKILFSSQYHSNFFVAFKVKFKNFIRVLHSLAKSIVYA